MGIIMSLRGLLLRKSILILFFSDFLNWDDYKCKEFFQSLRKMLALRRRRTTFTLYGVRRTEQNQAFNEEIGKRPEQLHYLSKTL
jgi:hypothetical protein